MKLYMVIRYCDDLPEREWGVNDEYTLVGIFDTLKSAEECKNNYNLQVGQSGYLDTIEIKEVVLNKKYEVEDEISVGRSYYIE